MPEYEYSVPMTFGIVGVGGFIIQSPWNTPCEMALLAVNPGGGDGGGFAISLDGPTSLAVDPHTAPNDGGARGLQFQWLINTTVMPAIFFPMPQRQAWAWWNPGTAGEAGSVVVIFRRALDAFVALPALVESNPADEHQYHAMMARQQAEEQGEAGSLQRGGTHAGRGE